MQLCMMRSLPHVYLITHTRECLDNDNNNNKDNDVNWISLLFIIKCNSIWFKSLRIKRSLTRCDGGGRWSGSISVAGDD